MSPKLIVDKLLSDYKLISLPIDVEELASKCGVETIRKALDNNISGLLVTLKSGSSYIVINSIHSSTRQRFSIAHEFAHYLLHKNTADVFVDNSVFFRDTRSSTGHDRKEVQANKLAAELLMPEKFIIKEVGKSFIDLHDEAKLIELANKFDVSSHAMTIRLDNLKLLNRVF